MDTNRQKVLQCTIDLFQARRPAHRVLIAQCLNVKLSVVDEAVKRLKEDGLVRSTTPGYIEPVEQFPEDEAISVTQLPNGRIKVEGGDWCKDFTPHEAQVLGKLLHGYAMEMALWREERRAADDRARLELMVRTQAKELADMKSAQAKELLEAKRRGWPPHKQRDLFSAPKKPRRRAHAMA